LKKKPFTTTIIPFARISSEGMDTCSKTAAVQVQRALFPVRNYGGFFQKSWIAEAFQTR
jgi:hypothetical protein